jgi:hypothetical protein
MPPPPSYQVKRHCKCCIWTVKLTYYLFLALHLGIWPFYPLTRLLAIRVCRFDTEGGVSVLVQRWVGPFTWLSFFQVFIFQLESFTSPESCKLILWLTASYAGALISYAIVCKYVFTIYQKSYHLMSPYVRTADLQVYVLFLQLQACTDVTTPLISCPLSLNMQPPQPNMAYIRRAMLDEVRFSLTMNVRRKEIHSTVIQNVQYFLLAIFWFTSKPITGLCLAFVPLIMSGQLDNSHAASLHGVLPLPRAYVHPYYVDKPIPASWSAQRQRCSRTPPIGEETPGMD